MSLYPELDNLDLTQLINCFHKTFPNGESDNFAYFGEVALRIRQQGKAGIDFLFEELDLANLDRLRGIILALTFPPPVEHPSLRDILLSYLHDRRPSIVADAVDGMRFLGATDTADAVLPLSTHPDPYVRGSVLRFVSHLFPLSAPPILLKALQDPHYIVRENAIDELDDLGAIEAINYIRPFLSDPHPDVVQAAQTAISNLEELASDKLTLSSNS
ncbi:MAG: HEAT repeat domain-containing protein [Oscillatoriales cyanobacterium RU_3_3]|nr:HEAT repeat domain-containing protein [Oscillatoriales cyanobacterium RU_3_3]NJR22375.1 HEAT repeat domain-containing protein [Richelia sp. CSU_2_1]